MDINVDKFKEMMKQEGIVIIDTRTLGEFEDGFICRAINYDVMDISFRDSILELDREKIYLVYCRSGSRSSHAVNFMENNGFKSSFNLIGGTIAWNAGGNEFCEDKK